MLALLLAAAAAAPAPSVLLDADVATSCAIISSIRTPTNQYECCESCALGMLRATKWITTETSDWLVDTMHEQLSIDQQGSGDLAAAAATESEVVDTVEKVTVLRSVTKPCGMCLTYDKCLADGGHVNTWHRTCSVLMT